MVFTLRIGGVFHVKSSCLSTVWSFYFSLFCSPSLLTHITFTPYIVQNRRLTLYADSVILIATGHLLLTRTSVRGVEVPKDGLRLCLTCNNFNDSTVSTKGTRRAYPIWVYTSPTSRRMHLVSSKDRSWQLILHKKHLLWSSYNKQKIYHLWSLKHASNNYISKVFINHKLNLPWISSITLR